MDFLPDFIDKDLLKVEDAIGVSCVSENATITEAAQYIIEGGGKRLRPVLTLLTSRSFDYEGEAHFNIAAALELLHTATLIHDDVIDKAKTRRGKPSVNAQYGDEIAILVADFLSSRSFSLAIENLPKEFLHVLTDTMTLMCEGEVLEIEKRDSFLSRADYLEIIRLKTAHLFSACSTLGALLAGAQKEAAGAMARYGLNFGMAFQIADDALDFVADESQWGKEIGHDFLEGKQTLPLIRTMELATPEEKQQLSEILQNGRNIDEILPYLKKYNAIEYSLQIAKEYSRKAAMCLDALSGIKYLSSFLKLSDFAASRSY